MALTRLVLRSRSPFAGGMAFGATGAYERLDGVAHFAVDPDHHLNAGVVDLDKAARDATGRVTFTSDFCLLKPVDGARANGQLLYEVCNRGRKGTLGRMNRALPPGEADPGGQATPEDGSPIQVGDGSMLRQGWTVAWCGWQWDVLRHPAPFDLEVTPGLLAMDAPVALEHGQTIQGEMMVQFQPDAWSQDHLLADRLHHPYLAADVAQPDAVLAVREWLDGPRTEIPRSRWRFSRVSGTSDTAASHVLLDEGFQPGRIYELTYRTRTCPVVGAGMLAMRDFVSFLRYADSSGNSGAAGTGTGSTAGTGTGGPGGEAGNPCAGQIRHTFAFGSSQSGRFMRTYLLHGLNVDEAGRQVFDGMHINVAGARRGEFNHRYGQPSTIPPRGFGHLPPFAFDDLPHHDQPGTTLEGLLATQRRRGGVPRIVSTNTAAEYWNRDASLLHTDARGERDVEPPPEVRVYALAGAKHGPGTLPTGDVAAAGEAGSAGIPQITNVLDFNPLLRTAFFNLVSWVVDGQEPPPNAFPRLADGTAADPAQVLASFRRLQGAVVPDPAMVAWNRRIDLGPDAARGIGRFPSMAGEPYRTYVSALDESGNEVAGIRLPDVSVPVASHTGWSPRAPGSGGEGQNLDMAGCTFPFAPTVDARQRVDDPRPATAERYASRDDYLERVREAALQLVAQRYAQPEDVESMVEHAAARYDLFTGAV